MAKVEPKEQRCRAIQVTPGKAHSARLGEEPYAKPTQGEIGLKVLLVGICGTDAEIEAGLYGEAPPGEDHLVPGHESLCEVEDVGPGVVGFQPGDLVVPIVRRPCPENCEPCSRGRWDMCLTGDYSERGIAKLHGMLREHLTDEAAHCVLLPGDLRDVGVLVEPLSIVEKAIEETMLIQRRTGLAPRRALVTGAGPIGLLAALCLRGRGIAVDVLDQRPAGSPKAEIARAAGAGYIDDSKTPLEQATDGTFYDLVLEASGYAPLVFRALRRLGRNGAMVLTGVTAGHHKIELDVDALNQEMVLENQVLVGSVNAARQHYEAAVRDLKAWQETFPGLAARLITARHPLSSFEAALTKDPDGIKSVVEVAGR
jgi:threonine dehydrogenase-like Zn-dependent dehydrogenase